MGRKRTPPPVSFPDEPVAPPGPHVTPPPVSFPPIEAPAIPMVPDVPLPVELSQGTPPSIPPPVVAAYELPALNPFDAQVLQMALAEVTRRRFEALKMYRPLPAIEAFHKSTARTRLVRGSNRASKTTSAAAEVAFAVTGQDPHKKYPREGGVAFLFGLTEHHLGSVMYAKLFRAGAFDMIRDQASDEWRLFDPVRDAGRKADKKPTPPLIPRRFVRRIAWSEKGTSVPKYIELTTGWEIYFFSSLGEMPQGMAIDLWWIDEEMKRKKLVEEIYARCIDRGGVGIWSATPQAATVQFYDLHDKAVQGDPDIAEFDLKLADNPYISQEEKDAFYNSLDEDARRVRFYGEFALSRLTVYPEFSKVAHAWDEKRWPISHKWSRWLSVDPGRQRCAVLFFALPPPNVVSFKAGVAYDELYIENCTAAEFATQVARKSVGIVYEGGVMDLHAGKIHEMGGGRTIKDQYETALQKAGVEFRGGGRPNFVWGCDDVMAGIEKVKDWLRIQSNGHPYFHICVQRLRWFLWEIERYRNKVDPETQQPTDKPHQKNNHLVDCFDAETEALTEIGWKKFRDIGDEAVATVNLQTDQIEYQKPTEKIARLHVGEMVQFGGHKLNALVTPNHRMVVYPKKGYRGYDDGQPVFKLAKDLTVWDSIKLHATWTGEQRDKIAIPKAGLANEVAVDAADYAELLGWYVAEGSAARDIQTPGRGYQVLLSQTKPNGRRQIRELLKRLPWHWCEHKSGFYTSSKQLWQQVIGLGYQLERYVPRWILASSPVIIERFLAGAVAGDGWIQGGTRTYATISRRLADDIQEAFIKTGRSASLRVRKGQPYCIHGRSGTNVRDQFWVREWICPNGALRNSGNLPNYKTVHHEGAVYCVTVPNGTIIVRRDGKPMIAGNCARYLALLDPQYRAPQVKMSRQDSAVRALEAKKDRARRRKGSEDDHAGMIIPLSNWQP